MDDYCINQINHSEMEVMCTNLANELGHPSCNCRCPKFPLVVVGFETSPEKQQVIYDGRPVTGLYIYQKDIGMKRD